MADSSSSHDAGGLRTSFAAEIPVGQYGRFRCELYELARGRGKFTLARRYWHLRWLIDYLGGTPARNFLGSSTDAFLNRIQDRVQWLIPEENREDESRSEARLHLLESSWAKMKSKSGQGHVDEPPQKRRKGSDNLAELDSEEEDHDTSETHQDKLEYRGPQPCQEFATSTFGLLVILVQWSRQIKATQKWTLTHAQVSDRCSELVRGLLKSFRAGETSHKTPEGLVLIFKDGLRLLDCHALAKSDKEMAKTFRASEEQWVDVLDVLVQLSWDEMSRDYGLKRKARSALCVSRLMEFFAGVIDSGNRSEHPTWNLVGVKQLEQLRTDKILIFLPNTFLLHHCYK